MKQSTTCSGFGRPRIRQLGPAAPIKTERGPVLVVFKFFHRGVMNLRLSAHFLSAALVLSSSALTPEECRPWVTPLSLGDPSMMLGRWNFLVGYVDHVFYKGILKTTDSSWVNFTAATSTNEVVMSQEKKMNDTCLSTSITVTVDGTTASTKIANTTSVFHLLPSCDGCLLMSVNATARDLDTFAASMKLNMDISGAEINIRSLYLFGREATLKASDLDRVRQQASCLGFYGDPDFLFDPEKAFCAEGEGLKVDV